MNTAEKIFQKARQLPEPLAEEILSFIGYLEHRHRLEAGPDEDLRRAQ